MARQLGDLNITVTVDTTQAEQAMTRVEEGIKKVGTSSIDTSKYMEDLDKRIDKNIAAIEQKYEKQAAATEKANKKFDEQTDVVGKLEKAVLRYVGPAAIGMAIKQTLDFASSVDALSKQSRMSTDAVQTLGFVAAKNGSSFQAVANAVNNLDVALEKNSKRTQAVLRDLGFSVDDLLKLRPEDRFRELGMAIGDIRDPAKRSAAALALFGPIGKDLLAMFDDLAKGAERDAPKMSSAWIEAMAEVDNAFKDVITTGTNMIRLFFGMGPLLRKFLNDTQQLGLDFQQARQTGQAPGLPDVAIGPKGWGPGLLPTSNPFAKDAFGTGLDYVERQLDRQLAERKAKVLPFVRPDLRGETDWSASQQYQAQWYNNAGRLPGIGPGTFPGWAPLSGQMEGGLPWTSYGDNSVPMRRPNVGGGFFSGGAGRFLAAGLGSAASFIPGMSGQGSMIGSSFGGALGGLKGVTGLLGSFAPFLGPIAGIAGGLIGKLFGGGEGAQVRKDRNAFIGDFGGMGALQSAAGSAGFNLDKLLNTKKTAEFTAEVKKLEQAMADFDKKVSDANAELDQMEGSFDAIVKQGEQLGYNFDKSGELVSVSFKKMEETASKYGISLDALGPAFQRQRLHEGASEIINDFNLLNLGGTETGTILAGMAPRINDLVNESIKFGVDIPANMEPWIKNLIDTGQLVDENGDKITDLSKIKFGDPIKTEFDKIQGSLKELVDKISVLIDQLNEMTKPRTINVGWNVDPPPDGVNPDNMSRGGFVGPPKYLALGGFIPRGTDSVPAMLTPGEGVMRREAVSRLMRGDWPSGGGVTVSIDNITVGNASEDDAAQQIGKAVIKGLRRKGVRLNAA